MGRIQDEINRRTVVNFFEMMRVRIKFKAHMSRKHSSRLTGIPQMDVPEIFIENEEDRANREAADAANSDRPGLSREPTLETTIVTSPSSPSALSPTRNTNPFLSADEVHAQHRSWSGVPADLSAFDSFYGADDGHQGHRNQASAFSFELHEPEAGGGGGNSNRSSRRGSTVRPEQVTEMLNSSVWMDSIRRSATQRRPQGGSEGGGGAWGGGFGQWQ